MLMIKQKKIDTKQNSISFLFAKKHIYYYYTFIWIVLSLYLFIKHHYSPLIFFTLILPPSKFVS